MTELSGSFRVQHLDPGVYDAVVGDRTAHDLRITYDPMKDYSIPYSHRLQRRDRHGVLRFEYLGVEVRADSRVPGSEIWVVDAVGSRS